MYQVPYAHGCIMRKQRYRKFINGDIVDKGLCARVRVGDDEGHHIVPRCRIGMLRFNGCRIVGRGSIAEVPLPGGNFIDIQTGQVKLRREPETG